MQYDIFIEDDFQFIGIINVNGSVKISLSHALFFSLFIKFSVNASMNISVLLQCKQASILMSELKSEHLKTLKMRNIAWKIAYLT